MLNTHKPKATGRQVQNCCVDRMTGYGNKSGHTKPHVERRLNRVPSTHLRVRTARAPIVPHVPAILVVPQKTSHLEAPHNGATVEQGNRVSVFTCYNIGLIIEIPPWVLTLSADTLVPLITVSNVISQILHKNTSQHAVETGGRSQRRCTNVQTARLKSF